MEDSSLAEKRKKVGNIFYRAHVSLLRWHGHDASEAFLIKFALKIIPDLMARRVKVSTIFQPSNKRKFPAEKKHNTEFNFFSSQNRKIQERFEKLSSSANRQQKLR